MEVKQNLQKKIIWITWEHQRRTKELSKALNVKLYVFGSDKKYFMKIIESSMKTMILLFSERPKCLIIQNPSMILAFFSYHN